ncbi:MAG TPA: Calx-beta domain-containing protein [Kofleriaceae bacterium]|nr:Calx-beta domain-containing protein [Kofleriaceae bacterium]
MNIRMGCGAVVAVCLAAGCGDNIKVDTGDTGILSITPATGLLTTESGGTATFQVALNRRPTEPQIVTLTSGNVAEGTVSPATLTIEPDQWDVPVTVKVTGVDDKVDDDDRTFAVHVGAGDRGSGDVMVVNKDDDTAGVTVTPTTGLQTSEAGTTATFVVQLTSEPLGNVVIPVSSSRPGEGTVSVAMMTFTAQNWNAAQTITVTGVDDSIADDDQDFNVVLAPAASSDTKYNGFDPAEVSLKNLDNDIANFLVTPTVGLQTTESQGTASFTVKLLSQPLADVTISVTSDTPGEGTVSTGTLTFTSVNWNAPQQVTVTGANDNIADGPKTYHVVLDNVTTTDAGYATRDPSDVSLTNLDNDTAGAQVTLTGSSFTTEAGGDTTFDVVLLSQPLADVTFSVASGVATEGVADKASLTFTVDNWNAPQTVTVKGQDDLVDDGDQQYAVVIGADAGYLDINGDPVDPADVSLVNKDNDGAGIVVDRTDVLTTDEGGGQDSFNIVLVSQPTADVTITCTSSNTDEGTISPASPLVFTPADWNQSRTVTLTGKDDAVRDGNQPYTVSCTVTSNDSTYNAFPIANLSAINLDNETIAITVSPLELVVAEFDTQASAETFDVVLTKQPTASVTIPLTVTDTTEVNTDKTSLTFTVNNWNVPQTVKVWGNDDTLIDGQQVSFVATGPATSADTFFAGQDADDVRVTNFDDESPGVYVQGHNLLKTQEGSNQPQFVRMRLTIAPLAPVTCTVHSSDTSEVSIDPMTFVFDATNFSVMQTITVRGVDDFVLDGDQLRAIVTDPCTSADPLYNLFDPRNIAVLNRDNE